MQAAIGQKHDGVIWSPEIYSIPFSYKRHPKREQENKGWPHSDDQSQTRGILTEEHERFIARFTQIKTKE